MKKKLISMMLMATMALSLAACGKTEDDGSETPTSDPVFKREEGDNIYRSVVRRGELE